MSWNPITWLPKRKAAEQSGPRASDSIPSKPEPRELGKIVREMREDYQVAFCEQIIAANTSTVQVTVASESGYEALAEKLQTLWDDTAASMTDDVAYGRVAYELVWETAGGMQVPRKAEALPYEDSRMRLSDDGSFDGIEIRTKDGSWQPIATCNSWWLALDPTVKYPHGQSRFTSAPFEVWKDKRGAKENRRTATRKWALRGPVWRGPTSIFDEQTGQVKDTLSLMSPAIDQWSKGAGLHLPNDVHPQRDDQWAWDVVEPNLQGFDPNALNTTIERLDVEMCRAFGIPEQVIIEAGGVGTYGSIAQKMLLLFALVEDIIRQRVQSFKRYVIGKVEETNGLPSGSITITFTPLTNQPDAFVFEVVKLLLANPSFIEAILSGGVDVAKLLEDAGLPVTEQLQAAMTAVAQRMAAAAPAVAPAATMAGEFGNTGRRQWQNNVKAINDVLADLIGQKTSEAMARELLQTLGLSPERVDRLIADAKDNATIDDPELRQQTAMANVVIPRQGFKVPQASQVVNAGLREFARLYDELIDAMAKRASQRTLDGIRGQIVSLEADMRTAGRLLGMLSPWQPRVNTYADGAANESTTPMTLADKAARYRFPWIEDALDFLTGKEVVTAEQFATMADEDRRHVFHAPGIDTAKQLKGLQTSLAKSLELGEDLRAFRKRIEAETALTRSQTETLYRTETKRGYVAGFDKAMKSPVVNVEFPAVLFSATPDQRVRDEHWDLDGTVCLRSDPAYKLMLKAASDYNCRCAMIPLSLEEAESRGIKTLSDLSGEVRAKYG